MSDASFQSSSGWPILIIAAIFGWFRNMFSPMSLIAECIQANLDNDVGLLFARFWAVPAMVILATNGYVLHRFGIALKSDPVLFLLYMAIACGRLVFEAFILVCVLWMMRLHVPQGLVLVCYTIEVVYAPLFNWLAVPTSIHTHDILLYLKQQNVGLSEIVPYFLNNVATINQKVGPPFPSYGPVLATGNWIINLFAGTLVAECISQAGKVERPRAYIAMMLALVGDIVPTVVMTLAQIFLDFTYISQPFGGAG